MPDKLLHVARYSDFGRSEVSIIISEIMSLFLSVLVLLIVVSYLMSEKLESEALGAFMCGIKTRGFISGEL